MEYSLITNDEAGEFVGCTMETPCENQSDVDDGGDTAFSSLKRYCVEKL